MDKQQPLKSAADVLDALGGDSSVRDKYGLRSLQAVWAWRNANHIPPKYYRAMTLELERLGCAAHHSVWGMHEPGSLSA